MQCYRPTKELYTANLETVYKIYNNKRRIAKVPIIPEIENLD